MESREKIKEIPLKAPHLALRDLVLDATKRGSSVRENLRDHFTKIKEFAILLEKSESGIFSPDRSKKKNLISGGVDGSYYPIQSFGNNWYVPFIVAVVQCRILNLSTNYEVKVKPGSEYINITPYAEVSLYDDTKVLKEIPQKIRITASKIMLEKETEQLDKLISKMHPYSTIFIDGPLIDPPVGAEEKYIKKRCKIFRKALKNDIIVVGVAKRINESYIAPNLLKESVKGNLDYEIESFCKIGDRSIIGPLFNIVRKKRNFFTEPLVTNCYLMVDNEALRYRKYGIKVVSGSFQQEFSDLPTRLELLVSDDSQIEEARKIWQEAMKDVTRWTYPSQKIPLPILLAHENCQVSASLARVLHGEFLTKAYDQSIEDILLIRSMTE